MSCSPSLLIYYNETFNENILSLTLRHSHDGWAWSHAVFIVFLTIAIVKYSPSLPKWLQNPPLTIMALIFSFEILERFITVWNVQLCYSYPSLCDLNGNYAQQLLARQWFNDTPVNSCLDVLLGLVGFLFTYYIMYKTNNLQWEPITGWRRAILPILFVFVTFLQNIVMISIKLNSCLPNYIVDPMNLFNGTEKINNVTLFWVYALINMVIFLLMLGEDIYYVSGNAEKERQLKKMYFLASLYIFVLSFTCLILIWGIYPQILIGWIIFGVIALIALRKTDDSDEYYTDVDGYQTVNMIDK
jgi:hypothetical protein